MALIVPKNVYNSNITGVHQQLRKEFERLSVNGFEIQRNGVFIKIFIKIVDFVCDNLARNEFFFGISRSFSNGRVCVQCTASVEDIRADAHAPNAMPRNQTQYRLNQFGVQRLHPFIDSDPPLVDINQVQTVDHLHDILQGVLMNSCEAIHIYMINDKQNKMSRYRLCQLMKKIVYPNGKVLVKKDLKLKGSATQKRDYYFSLSRIFDKVWNESNDCFKLWYSLMKIMSIIFSDFIEEFWVEILSKEIENFFKTF